MVMYREVCPEGVQNKCPGGGGGYSVEALIMSWGNTLILVISRGVQLYYGIAHYLWFSGLFLFWVCMIPLAFSGPFWVCFVGCRRF